MGINLQSIEGRVFDALCDAVTAAESSAFRLNMIFRDHDVHRICRAITPSEGGVHIGIGVPGAAWQWGTVAQVESIVSLSL